MENNSILKILKNSLIGKEIKVYCITNTNNPNISFHSLKNNSDGGPLKNDEVTGIITDINLLYNEYKVLYKHLYVKLQNSNKIEELAIDFFDEELNILS